MIDIVNKTTRHGMVLFGAVPCRVCAGDCPYGLCTCGGEAGRSWGRVANDCFNMNPNGTIDALLNLKGHDVWSVAPDQTVFEAIRLMAEKNLGAVLVMENGHLVGMLSERDYTRKIAIKGKTSKETYVREIMSTNLITITSSNTVEDCMRLMNDRRVRHLPVVDDGRVVGVLSIGNLVNWIISAQNAAIGHLEDYISGKYPR